MRIDLRVDNRAALLKLEAVAGGDYDRAVARALNRTAGTVRKVAAQQVGKALGGTLKASEIKAAMALKPRARPDSLISGVIASGRRRIALTEYPVRETASGLEVRIGRRRFSIPHAFITRRTRDRAVIRAPNFKGQLVSDVAYRERRLATSGPDYPIAELFAPGVPAAFIDASIQRALERSARDRFPVVIAQELRYVLNR